MQLQLVLSKRTWLRDRLVAGPFIPEICSTESIGEGGLDPGLDHAVA